MQTSSRSTVWVFGLWAFSHVGFCVTANAARVIKVGPSEEFVITTADDGWALDDPVCLYDAKKELVCGIISQQSDDRIGVKILTVRAGLREGQVVSLRRDSRVPASTQASTETVLPAAGHDNADFSGGIHAGFNYFYPVLHIQVAVGDALSIGLMPLYFNSNDGASQIKGFGGFVTLNYYITHFPFRGFFVQAGGGMYSMTVNYSGGQETLNPPAATASLQWRGKAYWGLPFDIGVGIGGQYLFPQNSAPVQIGFSGFEPLFTAYLGISL